SDARGRRAVDARADAARSADAARQDDFSGEAARRNAASPVHPRARARVSRRTRAGADDRFRVLPEPVRPRTRRSIGRGAPPAPGPLLDCDYLSPDNRGVDWEQQTAGLRIRIVGLWSKRWVRLATVAAAIPAVLFFFFATYYYVRFAHLIDARLHGE